MVAIKCSVEDFQSSTQIRDFKTYQIACINGSDAIVAGGPSTNIDALTQILHSTGVKVSRLSTPYTFHSAQMDAIVPEFEALARTIPFSRPQVPVASTLL